jgi:hypothetical protein
MSFYHDVVITSARYVGAVWSRSRNGSGVSEPAGSRHLAEAKLGLRRWVVSAQVSTDSVEGGSALNEA